MFDCVSRDYLPRLLKTNSRSPLLSLALARNGAGSCPSAEIREGVPLPFLNRGSSSTWRDRFHFTSNHTGQRGFRLLWVLSAADERRAPSRRVMEFLTISARPSTPQHWCFLAPPRRRICFWESEFRETKLWSVAALRNVSCIFVCHKSSQTPTTYWSGRKRRPDLDYVFDQCKHMGEIEKWAHGKPTRNESLLY